MDRHVENDDLPAALSQEPLPIRKVRSPSPVCSDCLDLELDLVPRRSIWLDLDDDSRPSNKRCLGCALLYRIATAHRHQNFRDQQRARMNYIRSQLSIHGSNVLIYLELFTSTPNTCPFREIVAKPKPSEDTGFDKALALITRWLQDCMIKHPKCNRGQQPAQLPTRVIEILSADSVTLRTTGDNEVGSYTSLSHCWGKSHFIQTTKKSLLKYQRTIALKGLSRTFQDAVDVTRRLGLNYIWIDSLCIIQDDKEDWHPTRSSDSTGGCFAKPSSKYTSRTEEFSNTSGREYTIHAREKLPHFGEPNFDEPLLDRAWVFQERFLSPRIVHFGSHELLWECMETQTCECTEWKLRPNAASASYKALTMDDESLASPLEEILPPAEKWRQLVMGYSTKMLSVETDTLPAIQGMAKHLHKKRQCAYYAGLWEDVLLEDLL